MNYKCNLCPNFFSYDPKKLGVHKKKVHEEKKHPCNICQKCFATNHGLKQHSKSHEKISENKITARRTFELSPSNWKTPYDGISKESVAPGWRFSPTTTNRRYQGEK